MDVGELLYRVEDRVRALATERALDGVVREGLDVGLATGRQGRGVAMRADLGDLMGVVLTQLVDRQVLMPAGASLDRPPRTAILVGPERVAQAWLHRNGELVEGSRVVQVRQHWDTERLRGLHPDRDVSIFLLPGCDIEMVPVMVATLERYRAGGARMFLTR